MDFSIPPGVPESVAQKLLDLEQEFKDGDITEKGYKKHRDQILSVLDSTTSVSTSSSTYASRQYDNSPLANRMSQHSIHSGEFNQDYQRSSEYYTDSASASRVTTHDDYAESFDSSGGATYADQQDGIMPIVSARSSQYEYNPDDEAVWDDARQHNMYHQHTPTQFSPTLVEGQKLQKPLEPRDIGDTVGNLKKFDNLPSILRHRGATQGRQAAIIQCDGRGKELNTIPWDKLASRAEKVAQLLREKSGLFRGDRVVLLYQDSEIIEFVIALMGCFLGGFVAVPLPATETIKTIAYIIQNVQAHIVLTTDANLKTYQRTMAAERLSWPRNVELWKTNEMGSYHAASKSAELPALQVPDLAYIEFTKSPLGELRGVVMSHRTILHQMISLTAVLHSREKAKKNRYKLSTVDNSQSIGLIVGVLLTVYNGDTLVWLPRSATQIGGLLANMITKFRISVLLSDYPTLKQVVYNYQSQPQVTRNYSKKQPVNLGSVNWCLIDALTVESEFHSVLADRWLKPLGNDSARDAVCPMLTLPEHGGMAVSMRDFLGGAEKLGCALDLDGSNEDDDIEATSLILDRDALTTNQIKILPTSIEPNKEVNVGAFGYPMPDATLAIVNPETCILSPELSVGEIWIDSPSLSGGFWGNSKDTDIVFHATCYDTNGPVEMEFLRTGILGFTHNGRVYVLGLYEDRLRQKWEPDSALARENSIDPMTPIDRSPVSRTSNMLFRYYYTAHLVSTITKLVPRVHDACAFDIYLNGEYLPVVCLETKSSSAAAVVLNEMCERCIEILLATHNVRVYCVLVCGLKTLPRIVRGGRSEVGNMLSKRRFQSGALQSTFVKFAVDKAVRNLVCGADPEGGIWSPAISQIRSDSLNGGDKQYSGVDFRDVVIDDRTAAPLSEFASIVHILQWRSQNQSDELAFTTVDSRAREGKGMTWKKFDQRIATVAQSLSVKYGFKAGNVVLLMYTHSEDFIVAVFACLILGVTAIPISPIDTNRLDEDVPALISLFKDYKTRAILVNSDTESTFKGKAAHQRLKLSANAGKVTLPQTINTQKIKTISQTTKDLKYVVRPEWLLPDFAALCWIYWSPDHKRTVVQLGHPQIMGMCKVQKETCQMTSTRPIVGSVRSSTGIGFLHTCFVGPYLGASTLIVSPIDYAQNPYSYFVVLDRNKVKDTYATPQMLRHACDVLRTTKGLNMSDTKNVMITTESRPSTDLVARVRALFSNTRLDGTAFNYGYSHVLNPLITNRSYMSLEPIDLWLDPIALRQGYVSIVNPENCPRALHLHDSGMVTVATQVAVVNAETCRLCKVGEYGEIFVYSEGNVASFYKSQDVFSNNRFHGKIADGNSEVEYVRTGDLGFLHTINRGNVEIQTLFVLGSIGETFEVLGLNHFPIDVEATIEASHRAILSAVIFQAGNIVVVIAEVPPQMTSYLASLVPVIVNSVLEEHQFIVDIVGFIGKGGFPRSRLGEKQRGKILSLYLSRKLNLMNQFGVSQGEKTLGKSVRRPSTLSLQGMEGDLDLRNSWNSGI